MAITFDMDADSLIHIAKPEDSHDRLYPISMGRYGPMVALPRILDTYRRLGLKQSFFIPGWCLETYPDVAETVMRSGIMAICMRTRSRHAESSASGSSARSMRICASAGKNRAATVRRSTISRRRSSIS